MIFDTFWQGTLKIGIVSKYFAWECDHNPRLRACVILASFRFCVVSFVWTGSKYISEEAGAVFHDILWYGHPTFCLGVATFYWMSIFDFSAFRGILTGFLNLKTLRTSFWYLLFSPHIFLIFDHLTIWTIQNFLAHVFGAPELLYHINFNWRAKC